MLIFLFSDALHYKSSFASGKLVKDEVNKQRIDLFGEVGIRYPLYPAGIFDVDSTLNRHLNFDVKKVLKNVRIFQRSSKKR